MQYRALILPVVGAVVATLGLAACGDDGGNDVDVTLSEFIVKPDPQGIDDGEVTFKVENAGGETHEFVVVKADSAEDLPTDADGAVDEEQSPMTTRSVRSKHRVAPVRGSQFRP